MAGSFGIPEIVEYLTSMGLRLANVDEEQQIIELAFHGSQGQWRMIVGIQQGGDVRKLLFVAPHINALTAKKRLECLEALMAINYRITIGKFGLDLDDGEIRLEETVPIGEEGLSLAQFQFVFGALTQTVAIYHSLIPRIVYGHLSALEALEACEREFMEENESETQPGDLSFEPPPAGSEVAPELDATDVLAEISRILEEPKDQD
ncbi:MAG: YbjN domain-containing protein [Ktedonobacteraceae bacterium]|nr:YbjN domain-containing protein [Ktedonobacteraceae bacterium]